VRQFVRQSFRSSCGLLHPSCGSTERLRKQRSARKSPANKQICRKTEGEGFEPSSEENPLKRFSRPFPSRSTPNRSWLHDADLIRWLGPSTRPGERLGERNRREIVTCVDGRGRAATDLGDTDVAARCCSDKMNEAEARSRARRVSLLRSRRSWATSADCACSFSAIQEGRRSLLLLASCGTRGGLACGPTFSCRRCSRRRRIRASPS
jgi:hypothetical protein